MARRAKRGSGERTCWFCGKPINRNQEWDTHHKVSKADGGGNGSANLATVHRACHVGWHRDSMVRLRA